MKDIEKAIETQQKLIKKWELRAQHLKETIDKFPWGRDGQQYDFGDWRESELKRRKQQIEIASITISALEKQEIYEEELEMIYKMADDMALTGNVPSSKEHAEAIQNYLDWVEAGQMVEEVENE